jgi:hypothetical protein
MAGTDDDGVEIGHGFQQTIRVGEFGESARPPPQAGTQILKRLDSILKQRQTPVRPAIRPQ